MEAFNFNDEQELSLSMGLVELNTIQSFLGYGSKKSTLQWLYKEGIQVFPLGKLTYVKYIEIQSYVNQLDQRTSSTDNDGKTRTRVVQMPGKADQGLGTAARKFLLDT